MCADGSSLKRNAFRCAELGLRAARGFCSLTDLSNGAEGGQSARDDLGRPLAIHSVGSLGFQQLGVGEDDTELVVQAMKERLKLLPCAIRRPQGRRSAARSSRVRTGGGPDVGLFGTGRWCGVAPQGVREDPDGSAGGPDVFDLTCGNPVVNRATADSDSLAGLHDREGLAVHICSRASSRRPSEVCTKGPHGPETTSRSCIGCWPPILSAACVKILALPNMSAATPSPLHRRRGHPAGTDGRTAVPSADSRSWRPTAASAPSSSSTSSRLTSSSPTFGCPASMALE